MAFMSVERKTGGGDKIDNYCVSSVRERNGHLLKLLTSVVAVVRKDLAERWLLLYVITVPAGCTRLSLYTAGKGTYVIGNVGHVDTQELRHGQG